MTAVTPVTTLMLLGVSPSSTRDRPVTNIGRPVTTGRSGVPHRTKTRRESLQQFHSFWRVSGAAKPGGEWPTLVSDIVSRARPIATRVCRPCAPQFRGSTVPLRAPAVVVVRFPTRGHCELDHNHSSTPYVARRDTPRAFSVRIYRRGDQTLIYNQSSWQRQ
jgi:hypothetical protein